MKNDYTYDFDEAILDEVAEGEVLTGWTMLPCFKCEVRGDEMKLVCNSFLVWIFEHIFAHFWTGKICITGSRKDTPPDEPI